MQNISKAFDVREGWGAQQSCLHGFEVRQGFCQGGWAEDAAGRRREKPSSVCKQEPDGLGVIGVERGVSVASSPC